MIQGSADNKSPMAIRSRFIVPEDVNKERFLERMNQDVLPPQASRP